MDRRLWIDGTPLDHEMNAYRVARETQIGAMAPIQAFSMSTVRRHGARALPGGKAAVNQQKVVMLVSDRDPIDGSRSATATDFAQLWANLGVVKELFSRELFTLGLAPDGCTSPGPLFAAEARMIASMTPVEVTEHWWRCEFMVEVPGAFWRDPEPLTVTHGAAHFLRGGTAPIEDALIMTPGLGPNTFVRLVDRPSGKWMSFRGDAPVGSWIRFEPQRETAYVTAEGQWAGGTEVAAYVEVGPEGFELSREIDFYAPANTSVRARRAYR